MRSKGYLRTLAVVTDSVTTAVAESGRLLFSTWHKNFVSWGRDDDNGFRKCTC